MATTQIREDVLERLTEGIAALANGDEWTAWLKTQSRFHRYSFNNTLLIGRQCPTATQVAGFHRWRELNRSVRKGEKGIKILAPCVYKSEAEDDERVVKGFRVAYVFDVEQTDGEALPEMPLHRLAGNDAGLFDALLEYANGLGYTVTNAELPGETNGDCTYSLRRIRIRQGLEPAQRAKTLCHEIVHAMLHDRE